MKHQTQKTIGLILLIFVMAVTVKALRAMPVAAQGRVVTQSAVDALQPTTNAIYQGVIYPEGLNIEQLRKKYPAKMFYDKFGPIEDCDPAPGDVDCDGNPMTANAKYKAENCEIPLMINRMTETDIKCLFANYDELALYKFNKNGNSDWRVTALVGYIFTSLKNKPQTSSFN